MKLDKTEAKRVLNEVKGLMNGIDGYTVIFKRSVFEEGGRLTIKMELVKDDNAHVVEHNDNMTGIRKNRLHPNIIGFEFNHNGRVHKVVKVRNRKMKYPVVVERDDGKLYRFQAHMINEEYTRKAMS